MIGKAGPFQIIESEGVGIVDNPMDSPRRRYDCKNYETCLDVAAALNWDSFTCRGCNGEIAEQLFWRARHALKKDAVVNRLCALPNINFHDANSQTTSEEKKPILNENLRNNVISIASKRAIGK
jgi:predicted Fe-S protein YdhL (DUF1289 family)